MRVLKVFLAIVGGLVIAAAVLIWIAPVSLPRRSSDEPVAIEALRDRIVLPDGFAIDYYAEGVRGARFLHFTEAGDLLVSSRSAGSIELLEPDRDGDGRSDGRRTLASGLRGVHGLDLHDGWLYLGETHRVTRVRFDAAAREIDGELELLATLPDDGGHSSRTVRVGPDGKLYVSIGSSCNVCVEEDERRAAIMRYELDGSNGEIYASGLRNSVGFDFHPETGEMFATDNGRDLLGDDLPPEEVNRIEPGGFYGWPVAYGDRVPDPDYGEGQQERIAASIPPVVRFGAHVAPLGIHFYRGTKLPDAYRGAMFIAQHGSWNRRQKDGYRVVTVQLRDGAEPVVTPFADHFEIDQEVIGRPVDVLEGPDGAIYISDDFNHCVYRVTYEGGTSAS